MENYPFFVIREQHRLNYAQESERIEGAKRRLKQYHAGAKAKQKFRISRLLHRNPNEKISEDDLVDLKRNLSDEISQLTKEIQNLKSKLTYLEQIDEIQKGSIYNTTSSPLIEKYVKTNSPDYRVQDLEIERDSLYNELKYLRESTTPDSLEDLQEEAKEHSEKIIELMSDCRHFQKLIDELDVKVQKFQPDPEYEATKNKKEEIKNTLRNEVELNEQLKQILFSGREEDLQSEPDVDYEDTVLPFTQELIFLKNALSEKKKEFEDLQQKNQQELDDIYNKKRSPDFFVTYRKIEDFDLSKRKKEENKTKQSQFELYQRLNTFHRTSVKEKTTPTITKPSFQNQNQTQPQTPVQVQVQVQNTNSSNSEQTSQTPPQKKKVLKKLGPPTFHETKHEMIINQLMQEKEKEKEKPVRRVKETSPHLLEPRKKPQHPPNETKTIKFYRKPPKSSQPRIHWKSQAQTQTQPQEQDKFKVDNKNDSFVTQQVEKSENEEEEKGDKLSFSQMMEKITNKLETESGNEQKEQQSENGQVKESAEKHEDKKDETNNQETENKEATDKTDENKQNEAKEATDKTDENKQDKSEIKDADNKKAESKASDDDKKDETENKDAKEGENKATISAIAASLVDSLIPTKEGEENSNNNKEEEESKPATNNEEIAGKAAHSDADKNSTENDKKEESDKTKEEGKSSDNQNIENAEIKEKEQNSTNSNEKEEDKKSGSENKEANNNNNDDKNRSIQEDKDTENEKSGENSTLMGGMLNSFANKLINNEKSNENKMNKNNQISEAEKEESEKEGTQSSRKVSEEEKEDANSNEPENSKEKNAALSSPMNSTLNDDFESFDDKHSDRNVSHEQSTSAKSISESDAKEKESKNNESSTEKDESEASSKEKDESEASSKEKDESEVSSKEKDESEVSSKEKDESEVSSKEKDESEVSSKEKDESEASSKEKDESEVSSKEKDESEVSSKEKDESEVSSKEKDESEVSSKEKDESEVSSKEKDESEVSSKEKNENEATNKEKNSNLLSGLIGSITGGLLKQAENEEKDKVEENDDDIVSASLSGGGKKKMSSNDGNSDSF